MNEDEEGNQAVIDSKREDLIQMYINRLRDSSKNSNTKLRTLENSYENEPNSRLETKAMHSVVSEKNEEYIKSIQDAHIKEFRTEE